MRKQPEITVQTRQNLIDAFWQLYCTKRIDKITVKEITAKAGYNRSTFYEYFTDVYDVLEQIENSLLPRMRKFSRPDLSDPSKPPFAKELAKTLEEYGKYYAVLLGDNGDPAFQNKMKDSMKTTLKQKLISCKAMDEQQADFILEYTLSAMIGVFSYWLRLEERPPIEDLLQWMHEWRATMLKENDRHAFACPKSPKSSESPESPQPAGNIKN